jgi:hypothetical protein
MALDPVTAALDIGGKLIDRLWPDPTAAAAAKLELVKLQQSGELALITGQLEINKAEAASSSVLVAGWRPSIGWVCSAALALQFVGAPLLEWGAILAGHPLPPLPKLDEVLWQLLAGMLGLGSLRTFEKVKGVAS